MFKGKSLLKKWYEIQQYFWQVKQQKFFFVYEIVDFKTFTFDNKLVLSKKFENWQCFFLLPFSSTNDILNLENQTYERRFRTKIEGLSERKFKMGNGIPI